MNLEEKLNVLKNNGYELRIFPDYQNDKELVLEAIRYNSRNLQYASDELKEDDDVLSVAIDNLDSEYWKKSKSGMWKEYTYDVDRFLYDMGLPVDVLKGKNKTAESLIDSGYFDYDNYYDKGFNRPRLEYKDIFGESFPLKVSEDGTHLEGIEEFENLLSTYESLDYELNHLDYNNDYEEYCQIMAKMARIYHRIVYFEARCMEWEKNASVLERISVDAITSDGTSVRQMRVGPVGALLKDILDDTEIMSDDDLRKKLELFQEKCTVVHEYMNIECGFERGQDNKLICSRIHGASEVINNNCRIASIDFKSGQITNYKASIREDWRINQAYIDESVMDSRLAIKPHRIEEIEDVVSDRKTEDINKVITEISNELKDKSQQNSQMINE